MDISILQHAKDKAPHQVTVDEVVIPPDERKRHAQSLAVDAMMRRRKASAPAEPSDEPEKPDAPDVF